VGRTALIVGAGIGGLSAAIALRHAGWTTRVFEQASTPRELGFGVALAPNAIAALRELGVADTVIARGYQPRAGEFRRMDGTVLKRAVMPPGSFGGPMLIALRPALHGALLDAVGNDALTSGVRATGFTTSDDSVSLQLSDGSTADGHVLIGADGVGSVIRQILHRGEGPPRHSGIIAVRGSVHGASHHLGAQDAVYYLGAGVESMFVRASDTGMYWFLSLAMQLVPPQVRDPQAIVALLAPRFDATFRSITSATDDVRADELYDRDPLPFWSTRNVTLLGDAAHPVLPHTGQGAAQAIVDAVTLGRLLSGTNAIEGALRAYERERMPKTHALLRQGRRTASLMAATNPVLVTARELILRAVPLTTFARWLVRATGGPAPT
jgi:2-polyprenyl-6-methoxyphenol hydroxylase-like FAD-dependent oxidoreductase